MKIPKLISHSIEMYWSCQGTMVLKNWWIFPQKNRKINETYTKKNLFNPKKIQYFFFVENKNNIKNTSLHCLKSSIRCPLVLGGGRGWAFQAWLFCTRLLWSWGCAKTSFLCCFHYLSTLVNLTLIILFSETLKFFKNYFFQIKKYCEEKSGYLRIFHSLQ